MTYGKIWPEQEKLLTAKANRLICGTPYMNLLIFLKCLQRVVHSKRLPVQWKTPRNVMHKLLSAGLEESSLGSNTPEGPEVAELCMSLSAWGAFSATWRIRELRAARHVGHMVSAHWRFLECLWSRICNKTLRQAMRYTSQIISVYYLCLNQSRGKPFKNRVLCTI